MSPSTNEYKPPPACTKMNPIDLEYYRNHPWESRVRAANRRIYKTTNIIDIRRSSPGSLRKSKLIWNKIPNGKYESAPVTKILILSTKSYEHVSGSRLAGV
jgi:hypothetical protein